MKKFLVLLFLSACGGESKEKTVEKFEGTASIGGTPAKITSCKAVGAQDGEVRYVTVEFGLDSGHTVIADHYAGSKIRKGGETSKLDCSKNSGETRDGNAGGSTVWSVGKVDLVCSSPDGELVLAATYDCGSESRPSNLKK